MTTVPSPDSTRPTLTPRSTGNIIEVNTPDPGACVDVDAGKILVEGEIVGPLIPDEVWVGVYPNQAAVPDQPTGPAPPPVGAVLAPYQQGQPRDFRNDQVPWAQSQPGNGLPNTLGVWLRHNNHWLAERSFIDFFGCTPDPKVTVAVTAKMCLWFAWAGTVTNGPYGENGVGYTPIGLEPIEGATSVKLSAYGGPWRHHPSTNNESGPNGLSATRSLENQGYKSPTYNSDDIEPIDTNLNKLLAMWEFNQGPPTEQAPATQLAIGDGTTLTVPENASKLFLGFHDGYEWSNNDGVVLVEVEWIVPEA